MKTLNLFIIHEAQFSGYNFESLGILSILSIFTAIFVIITKNPIISVLYLIGLFITIAIYLVLVGISFLGLSYLLVYVGAVSILFLFILMLINVRISELASDTKNSIPLVFITAISFTIPVTNIIVNSEYLSNITKLLYNLFYISYQNSSVFSLCSTSWENTLVGFSHINSIGNIMYTSHNIWLILVSLILLLAMVGTIVITLKYKDNSKLVNNQYKPYSYINLPLQSHFFSSMYTKAFWHKVLILFISGLVIRYTISTVLNIDICLDIYSPISIWAYSTLYLLNSSINLLYHAHLEAAYDTYGSSDFTPSYHPEIHLAMVKPDKADVGSSNSPASNRPTTPPIKKEIQGPSSPTIKTEVVSPSPQPLDKTSIPTYESTQSQKSEMDGKQGLSDNLENKASSTSGTQEKASSTPVTQEKTTVKKRSFKPAPVKPNLDPNIIPMSWLDPNRMPEPGAPRREAVRDHRSIKLAKFDPPKSKDSTPDDLIWPMEPTYEEIQKELSLNALKDRATKLEKAIDASEARMESSAGIVTMEHFNERFKKGELRAYEKEKVNKEKLYKELENVADEARTLLGKEDYTISHILPHPKALREIERISSLYKARAEEELKETESESKNPSKKIKLEDKFKKTESESKNSSKVKSEDSAKKIKSEPND